MRSFTLPAGQAKVTPPRSPGQSPTSLGRSLAARAAAGPADDALNVQQHVLLEEAKGSPSAPARAKGSPAATKQMSSKQSTRGPLWGGLADWAGLGWTGD